MRSAIANAEGRREHQRHQEQYRLQRLIEKAPIGIGIGSADGEVRVINDVMLHLHGLSRAEFKQQGMNWRDFMPPGLWGEPSTVRLSAHAEACRE